MISDAHRTVKSFHRTSKLAVDAAHLFDKYRKLEKETVLFESTDHVTHESNKSILMTKAALKAVCYGPNVLLTSVSNEGESFLEVVAESLAAYVVERNKAQVKFKFPLELSEPNQEKKLRGKSPLDVLRALTKSFSLEEKDQDENFLVIGSFAYDVVDLFEKLPAPKADGLNYPDYVFYLPQDLIVINHRQNEVLQVKHRIQTNGDIAFDDLSNEVKSNFKVSRASYTSGEVFKKDIETDIDDKTFEELVLGLKKYIVSGDVYQIVPSRKFVSPCLDAFLAYRELRKLNPSPYMFFIQTNEFELFGASPETFIKVDEKERKVEVHPIAGTRKRGFDKKGNLDLELDSRLELELKTDEKETAEHIMLVDLARNDIARVSKPKTRQVTKLLEIDRYLNVMHLVSRVEGRLKDDLDALHAFQASVNMGTLVGAPKIRAAEILRQTEVDKRGFFGGAVGYLDRQGNFDSAIVIRSALVRENKAYVRAGAGIVLDSVPRLEAKETKNKATTVLRAIQLANEGKA